MKPAYFLCSSPFKIGDVITAETIVYPEWWKFWKNPYTVREQYEVKGIFS